MTSPLYDYTNAHDPHLLWLQDVENHREKGEVRLFHSSDSLGKPRGHLISELPARLLLEYVEGLQARIAELEGAATEVAEPKTGTRQSRELAFVHDLMGATAEIHKLVDTRLREIGETFFSNDMLNDVLGVVFEGMTEVDEDNPAEGLTYCDDLSPLDVLKALGFEAPYTDLMETYQAYMKDGPTWRG